MKILMLNYEFPPLGGGGGKAHVQLLHEYAGNEDFHLDVLTSCCESENVIEQFSSHIKIYKVGIHKKSFHYWRKQEVIEWLYKAHKQLKKLLSTNQYDLAHAFFGFPTGMLTYLNRKRLPYIISLRGSDVPGANPRLGLEYKLLGGLFRKIWKNADVLVANSSGLAKRAAVFCSSLDYHVIPNGVDINHFTPAKNDLPIAPFKLITVGRLSQVKRLDLAIRSLSQLKEQDMNVKLTIVGNGNLKDELEALSAKLGLEEDIQFTGWLEPEQIPHYYQGHHAFILTSINEGMNNAMLEAMACGLPVISTACEGTEELITNNGTIVPEPEPASFAHAIAELINNSDQYTQMCRNSRSTAETLSWKSTAKQYIELYESICK